MFFFGLKLASFAPIRTEKSSKKGYHKMVLPQIGDTRGGLPPSALLATPLFVIPGKTIQIILTLLRKLFKVQAL